MIKINGKVIELGKFPDGTLHMKPDVDFDEKNPCGEATITWHYESNEEMTALMFLTKHLQNNGYPLVHLVMPYIPNARQDRVKSNEDVFTLKYFAEFINDLAFVDVTVLDPHSSVSEALINNIRINSPKKYIEMALKEIGRSNLMLFYPDEGAMKRYSGMISFPYAFGIKRRDWVSGNILGLDAAGDVDRIKGRDVLIVDDISSRGGTFYHSAKKLKELGANHIYLYITHCERTIFEGDIFKSGLIDMVFTTDSIFNKNDVEKAMLMGIDNKMEVFEYEPD